MLQKRNLETEILKEMNSPRALFILGARRCGKTSLLKRLEKQLQNEQKQTVFLDIEDRAYREIVLKGVDSFLAYISTLGLNTEKRIFIFLDEIQYLKDFASFVKLLVDHHSDKIKLILSGSSTAQIKYQFSDSLVGRKFVYELYPLDFSEFLLFKNQIQLLRVLEQSKINPDMQGLEFYQNDLLKNYEEFLVYGGYPEVVLSNDISIKQRLLQEIVNAYVVKDIRAFFNIEKIDAFNHLVTSLALQIGQLLNTSSLSKECKITRITVEKYINILEDSFIIQRVSPLFMNKKKELKKLPKIFFFDNGLRNTILQNLGNYSMRTDRGELLENSVFHSLWKNMDILSSLHFWRTKDGKEIDFVIQKNNQYIPYEVKIKRTALNHLRYFSTLYPCSELNLVRLNQSDVKNGVLKSNPKNSVNQQHVPNYRFLPVWSL